MSRAATRAVLPAEAGARTQADSPRGQAGAGGACCPFQWKWVEVHRIGGRRGLVRGTLADLTRRGWLEHNGNGEVRPSSAFPPAVAQALSAIGDPD